MHRILESFARFFSTAIVFVFLADMMLGTGTYFLGPRFAVAAGVLILIVYGLSLAVEVQSFLEQRQTRDLFQRWQRAPRDSDEAKLLRVQFRLHLGITCALIGFSMFNSVAFWALQARPADFWSWAAVVLRGSIIPLFFLAAGFLTPLHADARETINATSAFMLDRALKASRKHFKRRVKALTRAQADLTPLTIALVEDAGDTLGAERLRLIAYGLALAEGQDPPALGPSFDRPPTGPGTPSMRLLSESVAEARVRALLTDEPGASPTRIAQATGVSLSTASKYWNIHGSGRRERQPRAPQSRPQSSQTPPRGKKSRTSTRTSKANTSAHRHATMPDSLAS